jgi:hypothetical protein
MSFLMELTASAFFEFTGSKAAKAKHFMAIAGIWRAARQSAAGVYDPHDSAWAGRGPHLESAIRGCYAPRLEGVVS